MTVTKLTHNTEQIHIFLRGDASNNRNFQFASATVPCMDSESLDKVQMLRDCMQLLLLGRQGAKVAKGSYHILCGIPAGDWQLVWARFMDACRLCQQLVPRMVVKAMHHVVDSFFNRCLLDDEVLNKWRADVAAVVSAIEAEPGRKSLRSSRVQHHNDGNPATAMELPPQSEGTSSGIGRKRLSVHVVSGDVPSGVRPMLHDNGNMQAEACTGVVDGNAATPVVFNQHVAFGMHSDVHGGATTSSGRAPSMGDAVTFLSLPSSMPPPVLQPGAGGAASGHGPSSSGDGAQANLQVSIFQWLQYFGGAFVCRALIAMWRCSALMFFGNAG